MGVIINKSVTLTSFSLNLKTPPSILRPKYQGFVFFFEECFNFWLRWLVVALCGLSPVAVNGAALHHSVPLLVVMASLAAEQRL